MRTAPLLVAALLLTTLAAFAPGASAWRCVAAQDHTATAVDAADAGTFYNRVYQHTSYTMEELWQETNGEAGLQTSAGMSCGGGADKLVRAVCAGVCPIQG